MNGGGLKMSETSERTSCSDGTCTGIINEKGFCNVCGKPSKGWQEREEQKKIEQDKKEEIKEKEQKEKKNTEIQTKEEKIDIKNLLQQEIAKAKEGKRNKKEEDKNSQDHVASFFEPVFLAVTQLKSELSDHKEMEFRISGHDAEIHLGKNRIVRVEVLRYGGGHKFQAIEEGKHEHPEPHAPRRGRDFERSGEVIEFLVKTCAEFIVNQGE
jgi:hypothetical protein